MRARLPAPAGPRDAVERPPDGRGDTPVLRRDKRLTAVLVEDGYAAVVDVGTLSLVVLAFAAGATVPAYYAEERLRGFGRKLASRLPYEPPPGMSEKEAMREAVASEADKAAAEVGDE